MIIRAALSVVLVLAAHAASAAAPATVRVPMVLYAGQQLQYTAQSPLLTVSIVHGAQAVDYRFDRYGRGLTLTAKAAGDAKILCEHADNRIGEVLLVTVVSREVHQRYERVVSAVSGLEGLSRRDVAVAGGTIVVAGNVYSQRDLLACTALEKTGSGVVCAVRLSSASFVVQPTSPSTPRASLELEERATSIESGPTTGIEGNSKWFATVRVGDVPVLQLASPERTAVLATASKLVAGLNDVATKWRANADETGRPYPVSFRMNSKPDGYEVTSLWNFRQGSKRERLATLSTADLQYASDKAGVPPERLVSWWAALLEDAFRCYFNAERPARSSTAQKRSPVVTLYEDALRLHGSSLDRYTAAVELSRAYFAKQLVNGSDPFAAILTTVPPDFVTGGE